ncbi:MAG: hypothetical protein QXK47_05950 [Candidatus Bathyarchaeia archaeon]
MCYVRKFGGLLFNGGLSWLHTLPKNARRHALAALSNYAKFLGCYARFKEMLANSGLRWSNGNGAEFVFEKLYLGSETVQEADAWLEQLREKAEPNVYFMVAYTALTGMRPVEALNSLRLISERGLDGYLNREKLVLEHFRFPETFFRGNKKAFISVVTESLVTRLESWFGKNVPTIEKLQKLLERKYHVPSRLYLLRKAWATIMRSVVESEIVDLCQGRVAASIFVRSYYRPELDSAFQKIRQKVHELEQKWM